MSRLSPWVLAWSAAVLGAGHADATTTYTVTAVANSPAGGPCTGQGGGLPGIVSPVPVGATISCTDPTGFGTGSASAGTGILGITGEAVIASPFSFFAAGGGSASYLDTQVVFTISNPAAFQGTQATVAVLMAVHGDLQTAGFADSTASFTEVLDGQLVVSYSISNSVGAVGCSGIAGAGSPCAASVNGQLPSAFATVPIGVPVSFEMDLTTRAHAIGPGGASASANWGDTMSFPLDGPVFIVPDGVTVNAPDSSIVDNRFTPPATPVDETPAAALLAAGLAWVGALAGRRAREA